MSVRRAIDEVAAHVDVATVPRPSEAFASIPLPEGFDPTLLLESPRAIGVVSSYERPDHDFALVGIGEADRVELATGESPVQARGAIRELLGEPIESDDQLLRPRLIGGFRFAPHDHPEAPWAEFGTGRLVLPRILFIRDRSRAGVVLAPGVDVTELQLVLEGLAARQRSNGVVSKANSELSTIRAVDEDAWRHSVRVIANEIRDGQYEKAVLATSTEVASDADLSIGAALNQLRMNYPDCHVFSFSANGSTLIGASPELLVNRAGGRVHALGLAASQRRGDTVEEDDSLSRALLADAKSRIEHDVVVRSIVERLEDATTDLQTDPEPSVRRFRNIQHLATEVIGNAAEGIEVLDLVERLHPTPAVCGQPREVAREVIARHERFDRGWYAGPIGWLDGNGDGEFAVALRTALVRGSRAWLFAGNGIMADSDPEAELAEVTLKLRPLAEALGGLVGSKTNTIPA
jgi:menaquinone-specific isochorismate synthase